LSQKFGKIDLLAKGVRRTKSKKRGHLEVFNYVKLSASKSKFIDIITEAEVVEPFSEIRKSLNKISLAYYFVELINKTVPEMEINQNVFDLLLGYLDKLKKTNSLKSLKKEYEYSLIGQLGFWPKGKNIDNPSKFLENIVERKVNSARVGKRVLT